MNAPTANLNEPLFACAHAAITFALNYSMQQYDRPLMNRLAYGPAGGSGKGLSGLDGAAQAGMIRREISELSPLDQALVIASVAPHQLPRQSPAGKDDAWRINPEWQAAIHAISQDVVSSALAGCISHRVLRVGIVSRRFGHKVVLADLAERCSVAQNTATNHHQRVRRYLHGARGARIDEMSMGAVERAMRRIERRLEAAQMVFTD